MNYVGRWQSSFTGTFRRFLSLESSCRQNIWDLVEEQSAYYAILLTRCAQTSSLYNGRAIHGKLIKLHLISSLFLHNHLLNAYLKCGDLANGVQMFDEMPTKNVVSWTAAIAGLAQNGSSQEALLLFSKMHQSGIRPNEFTFVSVLNACSFSNNCTHPYQIYSGIVKLGFESNVFLANATITALIRHHKLDEASKVFNECLNKDVISWNAMIAGYLQLSYAEVPKFWHQMNSEGLKPDYFTFASALTGLAALSDLELGLQVHAQLLKCGFGNEICVGNSLVDMYIKCYHLDEGFRSFEEMAIKDVISWTQMAAGCLQCGEPQKALSVIEKMKGEGEMPNKFTLATSLNACANLAAFEEGEKIHAFRIKLGRTGIDICVDNALLDMYAKCGSMDAALRIFEAMKDRSIVSWTTMIMGLAQNGQAKKAVNIFYDMMRLDDANPNYITFVCVLYACSQGGLIDEGWEIFSSMSRDHGISPGEDHYVCMVDLLGRAGRIKEAEEMILRVPFQPGVLIWQTLVGACRLHGDTETGMRAAKHAIDLDGMGPSTYVLLSNMFAGSSNWEGVGMLRGVMGRRDVKKMPGSSWIEINGNRRPPTKVDGDRFKSVFG